MDYDILIINGKVLTIAAGNLEAMEGGFVGIKGAEIAAIGTMAELPPSLTADTTVDASGSLVMPGLVNTHTHAAMTLFRGLADDLPLMAWLQDHIFPAEARMVEPEMVYWCTRLAAAEMIMSGTTTVADGYFHEDSACEAFVSSGMRAIAAQGVIDFPAPGVPDPLENIKYAKSFIEKWQGKNGMITPAVFCHSPYTCSPETLQKAKKMAGSLEALLFIHVAETAEEREQALSQYGKTPVAHLNSLEILDEKTVLVHCVHLDQRDIEIVKERGAKISSCPESNMKLASGIAPLKDMAARGIPVGLGTDGCASNNDLDMFGEMDMCAKLHKVRHLDPTVMSAGQTIRMATLGGAQVLGLEKKIGSLEPGKRADVILVNLGQPHLTPFYSADLLVYAAKGADVSTVIIDGKVIMQNRELLNFDLQETRGKVLELSRAVKE